MSRFWQADPAYNTGRDGFFSSSRPSSSRSRSKRTPPLISAHDEAPARAERATSNAGERDPGVARQKVDLEEGFLAGSRVGAASGLAGSGAPRSGEDVTVEKSNVLMM